MEAVAAHSPFVGFQEQRMSNVVLDSFVLVLSGAVLVLLLEWGAMTGSCRCRLIQRSDRVAADAIEYEYRDAECK